MFVIGFFFSKCKIINLKRNTVQTDYWKNAQYYGKNSHPPQPAQPKASRAARPCGARFRLTGIRHEQTTYPPDFQCVAKGHVSCRKTWPFALRFAAFCNAFHALPHPRQIQKASHSLARHARAGA